MVRLFKLLLCALTLSNGSNSVSGQELSIEQVIASLQEGGYIIFMRHAIAPEELPTKATADEGNDRLERQLNAQGKRDAANFGESIRRLNIPLSSIESSPTFRTRETARLAGFTNVILREFLLQETSEMPEAIVSRLRSELNIRPESGNRLFVSHSGNIMAIFPDLFPYIEQGEALIVDPSGADIALLARILITEWENY